MAMPRAVQAEVDAADALQAELYPAAKTPAPAEPPVEAPVESGQPAVAVPEPVAQPTATVVELPRLAEPVKAVEPPKPVVDEAAVWKQRYDSLKGKYDAEVPALNRTVRDQSTQLKTLTEHVAALNKPPEPAPAPAGSSTTEEDVAAFGKDLTEYVERATRAIVGPAVAAAVAELQTKFGAVQEQVGQVTASVEQTAADRFWGKVLDLVPDWATIDNDPAWITFLDSTPDFSERTYRELALDAVSKGSAPKIAKLVEIWRGAQSLPPPAAPSTPPASVPSPQAELQRQVAPSTTKASTPAPQGERLWTKADYEAAYDVRNEKRFGKKRADEMLAEADRAVAEGRVRW